jgi:hypothetical protein
VCHPLQWLQRAGTGKDIAPFKKPLLLSDVIRFVMQPGEPTEQYVRPEEVVRKITGIRAHRVLVGMCGNMREDETG